MDESIRATKQRVILLAVFAFGAGLEFAFGITSYLKSASSFNFISSFLVSAMFLVGTVVQGSLIWSKLKLKTE